MIDMGDYEVRISALSKEDGGGFVAVVPELPGCMSDGETRQEALSNVRDAIASWIETAEALGRAVPAPRFYEEPKVSGNLALQG
ncbi:type II toxin-antitoxin system HicB family antitoxin [uncultured Selenomonas sp.]|uniref:type II toxin-antitoxin system HicB family antitoxin n=1 Tax=uncultured Selenomonas sp. TaxID=159275 RepID=UPI0025EA8529|nr:type II toxin-antitoxin system HicB family antitoxin [uncultured Selenomonas sp.]